MIRPSHHRAGSAQQVWIVFGGAAHLGWQRWLRPGFRHCFAALRDDEGWLVVDPLSRCLVVGRIDVPAGFDLPAFYRRAGLTPLGPFPAGEAGPTRLPALLPMHCVGVCRAVLGAQAPFALTPASLHAVLSLSSSDRKKSLTSRVVRRYITLINGRVAPEAKPAPLTRALAFFSSMTRRSKALMASLFKAPKPVRIDPPARSRLARRLRPRPAPRRHRDHAVRRHCSRCRGTARRLAARGTHAALVTLVWPGAGG